MLWKPINRWEWLAITALVLSVSYVGVLVLLHQFLPEGFRSWAAFVEGLPFNPNRALPCECGLPAQPKPGYRIVRQVNILLIPLIFFYLIYHARRDFTGHERITGIDLFLGAASVPLLPLLVYVSNCPGGSDIVSGAESNLIQLLYRLTMDYAGGGFIYLVGCLIFANGVTYLPAFALSRIARRAAGTWDDDIALGSPPIDQGHKAVRDSASLAELIRNPRALAVIRHAAKSPCTGQGAEEFVAGLSPRVQLVARLVEAHGIEAFEKAGIRSTTSGAIQIRASAWHVALALLCAITRQGFTVTAAVEEVDGECFAFQAAIPSSYLSWKGTLAVKVDAGRRDNAIEATAVFPGQRFAWGRGRRVIEQLYRDTESYVRAFERRRW